MLLLILILTQIRIHKQNRYDPKRALGQYGPKAAPRHNEQTIFVFTRTVAFHAARGEIFSESPGPKRLARNRARVGGEVSGLGRREPGGWLPLSLVACMGKHWGNRTRQDPVVAMFMQGGYRKVECAGHSCCSPLTCVFVVGGHRAERARATQRERVE